MMSPEHVAHPYPTEQEKQEIMRDTGLQLKQLTNWFVNNRKRYWKPRVEEAQRLQKQGAASSSSSRSSKDRDDETPTLAAEGEKAMSAVKA